MSPTGIRIQMECVEIRVALVVCHYDALAVLRLSLVAMRGSLLAGQRVRFLKIHGNVPRLVQFHRSTVAATNRPR